MAINFDTLPKDNPNGLIAKGRYRALIKSAEMKQPNDKNKPEYLNMFLLLSKLDGTKCGGMFDTISETTVPVIQFKLRRLIEALELPITGEFTLKDLCKIIPGKEMFVDITIAPAKDNYPEKNTVDVFGGAIYYSISDEAAINADDAEDAEETTVPTETVDY